MPNDIPIIADPLQPPVCIGCGYELTGLAPDCICPECGVQRDPRAIVLRGCKLGAGWRFRRIDALWRKPSAATWIMILLGMPALVCYYHFVRNEPLAGSLIMVIVPPIPVLAIMYGIAWYRHQHGLIHPVHLLISSSGVAQRTRFSPQVQWVDWLGLRLARFDLHRGYWRVFLKKEDRLYLPAIEHHRGRPVAFEFQASDETAAQVRALILRCIENAEREPPPTGPAEPHEAWDTGRR